MNFMILYSSYTKGKCYKSDKNIFIHTDVHFFAQMATFLKSFVIEKENSSLLCFIMRYYNAYFMSFLWFYNYIRSGDIF